MKKMFLALVLGLILITSCATTTKEPVVEVVLPPIEPIEEPVEVDEAEPVEPVEVEVEDTNSTAEPVLAEPVVLFQSIEPEPEPVAIEEPSPSNIDDIKPVEEIEKTISLEPTKEEYVILDSPVILITFLVILLLALVGLAISISIAIKNRELCWYLIDGRDKLKKD